MPCIVSVSLLQFVWPVIIPAAAWIIAIWAVNHIDNSDATAPNAADGTKRPPHLRG